MLYVYINIKIINLIGKYKPMRFVVLCKNVITKIVYVLVGIAGVIDISLLFNDYE